MKNIKKLSITLLASTMLLAGAGTHIFADEDTQSTTVSYEKNETYKWSIPSSINLNGTSSSSSTSVGTVEVTECNLVPTHKLVIKYGSNNPTVIKSTVDSTKSYDFLIGKNAQLESDTLSGNTIVLEVPANYQNSDLSQELYGKVDEDNTKYAGTFSATVNFTASIQ